MATLILAVEQSTQDSSAVVMEGAHVRASRNWVEERFRSQYLFRMLPSLLADAAVTPDRLDMFAVGLGPGAFAALRISLAAIQAMALPGGRPVIGISSAEALAADVSKETGSRLVSVVGDARRERLWLADYEFNGGPCAVSASMRLTAPQELARLVRGNSTLVTPDWERLKDFLGTAPLHSVSLVREKRVPGAETVAVLASERCRKKLPLAPLLPMYLHAPVLKTRTEKPGG